MTRVRRTVLRPIDVRCSRRWGPSGSSAVPAAATAPSSAGPGRRVAHHRVLDATVTARAAVSFGVAGVPAAGVSAVVAHPLGHCVVGLGCAGCLPVRGQAARRRVVVFTAGHAASATVVVRPGSRAPADRLQQRRWHRPGGCRPSPATTQPRAPPLPPARAAPSCPSSPTAGLSRSCPAMAPVLRSRAARRACRLPMSAVVALAVTVAAPARSGSLTVYPDGNSRTHSTIALTAGRSVTSLVVVKPGAHGRIAVTKRPLPCRARVRRRRRLPADAARTHAAAVGVRPAALSTAARVSWRAPADDGGTPVTAYTVVAQPGRRQHGRRAGTATSAVVSGLTNGTPYSLTVTAVNSRGRGAAGAAVTPFTVPGSPGAPTATSSAAGQATVSWAAPTDTGGAPVTGYQVTASPGGVTATSPTPAVTLSLPGGTLLLVHRGRAQPRRGVGAVGGQQPRAGAGHLRASPRARAATPATTTARLRRSRSTAAYVSSSPAPPTSPASRRPSSRSTCATGRPASPRWSRCAMNGAPGNGDSTAPSISADGRFVVFSSNASDLVAGDGNGFSDVFVTRHPARGDPVAVRGQRGAGQPVQLPGRHLGRRHDGRLHLVRNGSRCRPHGRSRQHLRRAAQRPALRPWCRRPPPTGRRRTTAGSRPSRAMVRWWPSSRAEPALQTAVRSA